MLIVTIIAAVVAGIVTFIMTNEDARKKFVEIWNKIKQTAKDVLTAIGKFFSEAWTYIKKTWGNFVQYFSDIWTKVKSAFSNVGPWFRKTFSDAWTAVKNVFSSWGSFFDELWTKIKNKFSTIGTNIATAISSSVKSGMNRVISSVERIINNGISLINSAIKLANKLPGVNVSTIKTLSLPRLAKGAIVNSPTIAEIGEAGREAVIPLERNTGGLAEIARKLNEYMIRQPIFGDEAILTALSRIYERLDRLQIVLDSGELVGGILDPMDTALNDKYNKVARGW
jgi:phage-related protein